MSDEAQIERRDPEQDFGMNLQMANGVYVQATYPAGDDDRDIRFDWRRRRAATIIWRGA
jgi:hypothetical protein